MTDEEKKAEAEALAAERLQKMEDSITALSTGLSSLTSGMKTMSDNITQLANTRKDPDKKERKQTDLTNIEVLSRKEFLDVIEERVGDIVSKKISSVSEHIKDVDSRTTEENLSKQVKEVEEKHKDFWEWRDEIGKIVKSSPGLSVRQAYLLAKDSNPEKATEMAEKYKSDEDRKAEEEAKKQAELEKNKPKETVFGGLTPTSGVTEHSKEMSKDTAAELAWDKCMTGGEE